MYFSPIVLKIFLPVSPLSSFSVYPFFFFLLRDLSAVPARFSESAVRCRRKVCVSIRRDRGEVWHMSGRLSLARPWWLQVSNTHSHTNADARRHIAAHDSREWSRYWKDEWRSGGKKWANRVNVPVLLFYHLTSPSLNLFVKLQSSRKQEDSHFSVWHRCELVTFLSASTTLCQIQYQTANNCSNKQTHIERCYFPHGNMNWGKNHSI